MTARDHHYLFSHVHLRNQALRNPEQVLKELSGPLREGFLFFLWQQVEEVANEKVSAVGLKVAGVDTIGGGTLALIELPAAERPAESIFAAVFAGPAGARYFVFDRAVSAPDEACLAELELDDTRINMGNHPATQAALLEVLARELSVPRPASVRPPATMAMPAGSLPGVGSSPGAVLGSSPGSLPGALPGSMPGAMPGAGGAPTPAARPKSKVNVLAIVGLALFAPVFCCLATGVLAYDSGMDADAALDVQTELSTDAQDHEQLVIRMSGPEEIWRYTVTGPGAEGCDYISAYREARCEVRLDQVADPTPTYRIEGRGHGPRLFGESIGDVVDLSAEVEVVRPLGLRWSEVANATVVSGFPGRLAVNRDGALQLLDAPPGTTLNVGGQASAAVQPAVALDVPTLVNQAGVSAVLEGGGRVSIPNVTVRLADGTTAGGAAQVQAGDLRPALLARLAELGDANLGPATGTAAVWIQDGAMRQLVGAPQTLADLGRVVLSESTESTSGRCGPYGLSVFAAYGDYIPRSRWTTTVTVYDRVEDRRAARRRFRGERPSCPQSISMGTRRINGPRANADADAYATEQLAPPPAE